MNFSVLMAVYKKDKAEWLDEALNSITYNQTIKPSQIVLVEDGPIDDSLKKVIQKYSDLVTSVILPENKGLDYALNEGLKYCKYQWIARMDSDDISHKDRFKIQTEFITKNPDYDVVGTGLIKFITDPTKPISYIYRGNPYKMIKFRSPMSHATVFYKKDKLLAVDGYGDGEAPYLMEDYWLWAKMVNKKYKMYTINEYLYYCRVNEAVDKRRGGFKYFKGEMKMQIKLYSLGIISAPLLLRNIIVKGSFRLIPSYLRGFLYKKVIGQKMLI